MCILPMFGQWRKFKDSILEIDGLFSKFGRWPISEGTRQMIGMLKTSDSTKYRDEGYLIFRKLRNLERKRHKKMVKGDPFVVIGETWLVALLEVHLAQSEGIILTDIRMRIIDLYTVTQKELGNGYRAPECLRRWLLEKNDVLVDDAKGLTDGEII